MPDRQDEFLARAITLACRRSDRIGDELDVAEEAPVAIEVLPIEHRHAPRERISNALKRANEAAMEMPRRVLDEHNLRAREQEGECDQDIVLSPRTDHDVGALSAQPQEIDEIGRERLPPMQFHAHMWRKGVARCL